MKKAPHVIKMFRLNPHVAEVLNDHADKTNKTQTHLVERAILRCYGKEKS
jgi:hypothetical protein